MCVVYTWMCVCVYMNVCSVYMDVCMCIHVCVHVYTWMCLCVYIMCVYCMCVCVCVCICIMRVYMSQKYCDLAK